MYLSQTIRPFISGRKRRRRGTRSWRRRSSRGGKDWHLEGIEPDGTEPLLGVGGGHDVVAGEGVEVEGRAAVRARLLGGRGGAEAVLEAHHNLLQRLRHHHSPLSGGGVRVQQGVQLQAADPGESGFEEHHPHFPPRLLLQKTRKRRGGWDKCFQMSGFHGTFPHEGGGILCCYVKTPLRARAASVF